MGRAPLTLTLALALALALSRTLTLTLALFLALALALTLTLTLTLTLNLTRWAVHGKMSLVDMPLALVGWAMPDGTQCFATGDDHGQIHIYDAKRLMALVRPDDS